MSESHTFVRLEGLLTSLHCLAKLTVDLAKEYHDDWCSTERKEEYILERFNDKIQDLEATLQIIKQLSTRETTSLLTTDDTTMAVETQLRRKNTEILPSNETIDISSSEDSFSSEELKPPPERRSETSRCQQQDESLFRLTKCRLYSHETEQRVNHVTEGDTVSPIACETASRVIQLTTADSIPPPFNFVSGCSQDQCSSKEIISNLSTASSFKDTDGNNSMAGTVSYVTRLRPTKQSVVKTSGVRRVFGSSQRKRKMSDPNPIDLLSIMKYKHRRTPSTVVEPNIVRMIDAPCVEFEKSFRTNEPLGAYFVTERVDGRNICKIISLQLGGQAGVDVEKRIRVGKFSNGKGSIRFRHIQQAVVV